LLDRGFRRRRRRLDARKESNHEHARTNPGDEAGENFPMNWQRSSSSIASSFASG
jgi:hypothetical protein